MEQSKHTEDARQYLAAGTLIICSHCKNDTFAREQAMLNKPVSTLLKLDWADRTGVALVCSRCGLIQWFLAEPEPVA